MLCNSLQDIALLIYLVITGLGDRQTRQYQSLGSLTASCCMTDFYFFKWCTISKTCRGILREVCLFLQMALCKVIILQCFPTGSLLIQDIFLYTHGAHNAFILYALLRKSSAAPSSHGAFRCLSTICQSAAEQEGMFML